MSKDSHLKIIIVEDMDSIRKMLISTLNEIGYQDVTEAPDGDIAWNFIIEEAKKKSPFSLIISDISMPNMSGLDLLDNVRGHELTAEIPFLIVTSINEKPTVLKAIAKGASNYITKPIVKESLEEKINKVLKMDHSRPE